MQTDKADERISLRTPGSIDVESTKRYVARLAPVLAGLVLSCFTSVPVSAAIISSGVVFPTYSGSDPWMISGNLNVPSIGSGALQITNGSVVTNATGNIGVAPNTTGTVTVIGAGSTFNNNADLLVGIDGKGTLNIGSGGVVHVKQNTMVGYELFSNSTINFNGGILNTRTLYASPEDLLGAGTINASTMISDLDLLFDSSNGLQQQIVINVLPSQNIVINLDAASPAKNYTLGAGYHGVGSLTIADGLAVQSYSGTLSVQSGSQGTATITGSGSRWVIEDTLYLGVLGGAFFNIDEGGNVTAESVRMGSRYWGSGTARVSGSGSRWDIQNLLAIGDSGSGELVVEDGAVVYGNVTSIGENYDSSGSALVTGNGSQVHMTGSFYIGRDEYGSVRIEDGAVVTNGNSIYIGYSGGASGNVTVAGPGSTWVTDSQLVIGLRGSGVLNILDGGIIENKARGIAGDSGTATATVVVSGQGSAWINHTSLDVGRGGTGALTIENGGQVLVGVDGPGYRLSIGNYSGGTSRVDLLGGMLVMNQGHLLGTAPSASVFNFTGGKILGAALIDLAEPLVQNGGTLAPGMSIGQTDIIGDYTLTAGTLEIELGGLDNPIDLVTATGDIDISILGTTLDLRALGSMAAGTYTVLESTGGTITGMFENVSLFNLFGVNVTVLNTGTAITVTLDSDLVFADPNSDGFVGIADLNIVLGNWNQNVTPGDILAGDLNGDGFVGIEDLNAILGNWNAGTPPPPPGDSAAIPEPGTVGVLVLGVLWGWAKRQRDKMH